MYSYDTVSEALAGLKSRGYIHDFNLDQQKMYCPAAERHYHAPELHVVETYRFEGATDPADEAVVYAIAADDGVKGVYLNGYGIYTDPDSQAFLEQIKRD